MKKHRIWSHHAKSFIQEQLDNSDIGFVLGGDYDGLELQWAVGIKDKTGREIFEGDILSFPDDSDEKTEGASFMTVEWHGTCWCYKDKNNLEPIVSIIGFDEKDTEATVIGNIFETPEFLTL